MKKRETICTLLGTSQIEMAMLLKINRSQWSMYESGKRDLPLAAKVLLGDMLTHVKLAKAKASKRPSKQGKQETKEKLEKLLKENEYKVLVTDKKVAALEKKQVKTTAALHLINYFENNTDKKQTDIEDLSKRIQIRTKKEIERHGLPILVAHQIKQQVLQYEAKLITAALKKIS